LGEGILNKKIRF